MRSAIRSSLLLLVLAAAAPARAAELEAAVPSAGSSNDAVVAGTIAYVADGAGGLRIFDLGDPAQPDEIGTVPPLPGGSARSVDLVGTRAYVANEEPGVQIVDVSNPAAPAVLGSFDPPLSTTIARAAGNVVYAASSGGLSLWDVSNPAAPAPLGALPGPPYTSMRLAAGHLVATTATAPTFRVIAVSNPLAPAQVGSRNDVKGEIGVDGDTVWVTDDSVSPTRLFGVRLGDPAAPERFANATSPDAFAQLNGPPFVRGRLLIGGGLLVANVSGAGTPQPERLGAVDFARAAEDVEVVGNRAYVTTQDPGGADSGVLAIVDVTVPGTPSVITSVPLGRSWGVDVVNDGAATRAYVASDDALAIVDVTSALSPVIRSQPSLLARVLDVDVSGTTAYALGTRAAAGCELISVNVANPASPAVLDRIGFAGAPGNVVADGAVAWVACQFDDRVRAVDVSNPGDLRVIATITAGSDPRIDRDGDFLYVASNDGVRTYNVANPASPVFIGELPLTTGFGSALRVDALNRLLYVPGLRIFDARDLAAPFVANERVVEDAVTVRSLRVAAGRLYVPIWRADLGGRLAIYSLADAGRREIAPIYSEGLVGLVTAIGADLESGLVVQALGALGFQVYDASADIAAAPCADGRDNDGDGLADLDDEGCFDPEDDSEQPACSDGLDNDGDGPVDYPADAGCVSATGRFEDPQCQDGVDNDGDGGIDYPADTLCVGRGDNDELTNARRCGLLGIEPVAALGLALLARRRRQSASTRSLPSKAGA